jgi:hypothetical protein
MVAGAKILCGQDLDDLIRLVQEPALGNSVEPRPDDAFYLWTGYINALIEDGQRPALDELLMLAAIGFLGDRTTEVRAILRRRVIRIALDDAIRRSQQQIWAERVRENVSVALLLLIRQETREDVEAAGRVLRELAAIQSENESQWVESEATSERDAAAVLGLYHLAQAVVQVSEYLLTGGVQRNGRIVTDFSAGLNRLLIRAEEYLDLSGDIELKLWLAAVGVTILKLRQDSIWATGGGISQRIDALLQELAKKGRERPVFSLLPSQREALNQSLLDPARMAIVLQMPTSSGKTLLAEFSIVQTLEAYRETSRVAYLTPTRALATQVRRTLLEDLRPLGISVAAAGSAFEEDPYELNLLESTDGVVVATPEKLDLLMRVHSEWFNSLRLIVVDEAHLLKDSERGVRLELLLANLRREQPQARLLLLTPFVENASEIATWLGGARGMAISVFWRPSRLLLGIASISGAGRNRALTIEWNEPFGKGGEPDALVVPTRVRSTAVSSALDRVVYLAEQFSELGTILAMFTLSRTDAEEAARRLSAEKNPLSQESRPAALRLAIALAKDEFGPESVLTSSLERGTAYHHSALSPILRYLIEDQVRVGSIQFVAATTTLAQGVNFPVSTVIIHSVSKPYGNGDLSPSEFWNIAGRAGRVGMADEGLVVFANPDHRESWRYYSNALGESLRSGLLAILGELNETVSLKELYRQHPELRPFFQYLTHAAANRSPAAAIADLDELLQASLANAQLTESSDAYALRSTARRYLREEIAGRQVGYLKTIDSTGLGTFSFNELYAKIGDDPVLLGGPGRILRTRRQGLHKLIEALRWLPELSLGITGQPGEMDVELVAKVVDGWMSGRSVRELSQDFPGTDEARKVRSAATYLYQQVSQLISWGAHAYIRGWSMRQPAASESMSPDDAMLPAFIQYGVKTPEAALASLLSVPRQLAEPFGVEFRKKHGAMKPEESSAFKVFLEEADLESWGNVVAQS